MRYKQTIIPYTRYPIFSFCKTETESIEYLFYQCKIVKIFWDKILYLYNQMCVLQRVPVSESLILCAYYESSNHEFECLDVLIAVGKEYLWNCKTDSPKLDCNCFIAN